MDISSNEFNEIGQPIKLIFLWGMMGIGKTKTAKQLANKIGWQYSDTDEIIEAETGMKIAEIFSKHGEDHFRALEKNSIEQLCKSKNTVISTGGGLPCFSGNADLMNLAGLTIWLDGNVNFVASRLVNSTQDRPLLSTIKSKEELIQTLSHLVEIRKVHYQKAQVRLNAMNLDMNSLVKKS